MKKILIITALLLSCLTSLAESYTDVYALKMVVKVPRIYDNNTSQGYRKYQAQTLTGYLYLSWDSDNLCGKPTIAISNLVNKTHKINGKCITYSVTVDNDGDYLYPRINMIGNNKKNEFKTPSVIFYMDAEPSYNRGEDDEDNSLLVTLAADGTSKLLYYYYYNDCFSSRYLKKYCYYQVRVITKLNGYLTGTLGCGCKAYGHKSPTRTQGFCGPTSNVDDVAVVYGKWMAKLIY